MSMNNKVLLVVDVQTLMIDGKLYNQKKVIHNLKSLISKARENGTEVIYVRHDDGIGSELEAGSDAWQIYYEIVPIEGEKIFDKKFNSAFVKTGLKDYLESKGVKTIILTGLQTEYCIDATVKSVFEHGFELIIPEETNSTFDNEYLSGEMLYRYYNFKIWNKRFGKVLPFEQVINEL